MPGIALLIRLLNYTLKPTIIVLTGLHFMRIKKTNTTQNIQIAGAIILLLSILPLPYGFYTIVKVAMMIISGYLAYRYYSQRKEELAITFLVICILFQPFVNFALGRQVWLIVDIVVAILLLLLAFRRK